MLTDQPIVATENILCMKFPLNFYAVCAPAFVQRMCWSLQSI